MLIDQRPPTAHDLSHVAHAETTTGAVEAERRRVADVLDETLVEALNALIARADRYERLLTDNDEAQMVASVLGNQARGILQDVRDLQANLYPSTLETLGLEPALQKLVEQVNRASKVRATLISERLRERPSPQIELAIFRSAQEILEYMDCDTAPTDVTLRLETDETKVVFVFSTDDEDIDVNGFPGIIWRVEVLGGQVATNPTGPEGFELQLAFPVKRPVEMTEREMDVLHLLGEGLTNKEIAERMSVSPRTVNFHLDNIYNKLGVNTRTEAVVYALRHHWIRRLPGQPG